MYNGNAVHDWQDYHAKMANKTTVAVVEKTVIMAIDIAEAVRSGIASKDTLFQ